MDNMTILCRDCQQRKGNSWWDGMVSLWQEEHESGRPPSAEETQRIENEKRHLMANPGPGPLPTLKSKPVWEIQQDKINDLFSLVNKLNEKLVAVQAENKALGARLDTLASKSRPGRKPDEITAKIVEFLKSVPGLKFNSGSVASNIGVGDSKLVSTRLKTLFGRGMIKAEKVDMLSAMYWYEEEKESK